MKFITSATESTEIGIVIESDTGDGILRIRNPRINGINYRLSKDVEVKIHIGDIIGIGNPPTEKDVPAISVNGKLHFLKKV